jgi:hypothetical protein
VLRFSEQCRTGPNLTSGGVGGLDDDLEEASPEDPSPPELVAAVDTAGFLTGACVVEGRLAQSCRYMRLEGFRSKIRIDGR